MPIAQGSNLSAARNRSFIGGQGERGLDGCDKRVRLRCDRDHYSVPPMRPIEPTLKDIYREVDTQIGVLIETAGPEATVLVFSLHGMRPTHGVPSFVQPLLCELGYSRLADWSSQTWAERAIATMGAVKRQKQRFRFGAGGQKVHRPSRSRRVLYFERAIRSVRWRHSAGE
ncbi:MAG TPA: hypothetical protein VJ023_11640 [Pyrinomonadaceae bacterium]|nr:hypothetical protein [Pyrinomonadaceae bacterium]